MQVPNMRTVMTASKQIVYLVDDDPRSLEVAESILAGEDLDIRTFANARVALDVFLATQHKPRLLVADYSMNEMNGFELIQRCRAAAPDLRVVMVSGTLEDDAAGKFPFKIDAFVAKPFRPEQLIHTVRQFVD